MPARSPFPRAFASAVEARLVSRSWRGTASSHRPSATVRSRSHRRARGSSGWRERIRRRCSRTISGSPTSRKEGREPARRRDATTRTIRRVERTPNTRALRSATGHGKRLSTGRNARERKETRGDQGTPHRRPLPGRRLLLLYQTLAVDAVAGERQRLEPLFGDRLAAPLANPERPFLDFSEGTDHFLEESPVAVAQLEKELAVVGIIGLVPEVLDRVVLLTLRIY